jgi:hypothetical protein
LALKVSMENRLTGMASSVARSGTAFKPTIDGGGALSPFTDRLAKLLDLGGVQVFADGLMRRRLAGEDEIAAGLVNGGDDRQAKQTSPRKTGRGGERDGVSGEPAPGGVTFAILLLCPVLRRDEFRWQRRHLLVAGCDQAGAERKA